MAEPPRFEGFNWSILLVIGKKKLGLSVSEFWALTFAEWWPLYNVTTKGVAKPMDSRDLRKLNERFLRGQFRRIGG